MSDKYTFMSDVIIDIKIPNENYLIYDSNVHAFDNAKDSSYLDTYDDEMSNDINNNDIVAIDADDSLYFNELDDHPNIDRSPKETLSILPGEIYAPIPLIKYYKTYLISNYGNVYSIRDKILKICTREGYPTVCLSYRNTKTNFLIHRLVALVFVPNPDPERLEYVNHIDGNRFNSNYLNLEWVTLAENAQHSVDILGNGKVRTYRPCEPRPEGRSLEGYSNYIITEEGRVYSMYSKRFLILNKKVSGYMSVMLNDKSFLIHRLVATLYISPIGPGMVVNHFQNLEVITYSENSIHALENGKNVFTRAVHQYHKDGRYIITYPSILSAYLNTNVDRSSIVRVCKGRIRGTGKEARKSLTAGGFIWRYAFPDPQLIIQTSETIEIPLKDNDHQETPAKPQNLHKCKAVIQHTPEGPRHYPSIAEANKITKIDRSTIIKACKNPKLKAGGFSWEYDQQSSPIISSHSKPPANIYHDTTPYIIDSVVESPEPKILSIA